MLLRHEKNHTIDVLFPIALLFVFAASSFIVILLSANIYRNTTAVSTEHYEARTPISYITEKIRQTDASGNISVGSFDGCEGLILAQTFGNKSYTTYIYSYDGKLMELFIQDGVSAHASDGTKIMNVQNFMIEEIDSGLFHISCEASDGKTMSAFVSAISTGGDQR